MEKQRRFLGLRLSAIIETLSFLSIVTAYDCLFGQCDRYVGFSPHPFSIIVLLITVQYGTLEGIFSAVASTFFLYVGNIPEQQAGQTIFEYQFSLALMPLIWFIAAFVIGEIRMRLEYENYHLKREYDRAKDQLFAISEEYLQLKESKENLEAALVSQHKTTSQTYRALQALETLNPSQVVMKLNHVIEATVSAYKYSVYALGDDGLEIVTSHGWLDEDAYKLRIVPEHPLFVDIVAKQRIVCLVNRDDEQILDGEGVLAGPLIDTERGQVFGMLKIEDIDFIELNISNLESFKMACELIGMAYANARRYHHIQENSLYQAIPGLYSYSFYQTQKDYLFDLMKRVGQPLISIEIRVKDKLPEGRKRNMQKGLLKLIQELQVPDALCFHGKRRQGDFLLLLPFMSYKQGEALSTQIAKKTMEQPELKSFSFYFLVDSIWQPQDKEEARL